MKKFTEEQEKEIIEFFKTHSNWHTCRIYGIHLGRLEKILAKYGLSKHPKAENDELIIKNRHETCIEHFGAPSYMQTTQARKALSEIWANRSEEERNEIKQKQQETFVDHYGVSCPFQCEAIKEKSRKTCKEKYGVENSMQSKEVQEKSKQTCLKNNGVAYPAQNKEINKKMQESCIKNNGGVGNASEQTKHKCIETMQELYGVDWNSQTIEYHKEARKHYIYKDVMFDSLPELCLYLYCEHNSIEIIRCPSRLEYSFDNKQHYYIPDFLVNGELWEIKSDFLYEKMLVEDTIDNAKYKCMLENHVKILLSADYQKYLDWFKDNNYLAESFLVKKIDNNKDNAK